ncbi:MAG: MgtC/SapB family protein [Lachnospiraceae bacterium]|nr:MgtC/SapB family protein [Lachnospiraceae bacterium]
MDIPVMVLTQMIYFLRIGVACICGILIGTERQQRTKVAGVKTHMMISLAAALMMLISKYGFTDVMGIAGLSVDVSRVAAGIITGVGILGGGLIYTGKQGAVSGITTAAGVWVTIGIGMAIGSGMYALGIGTTGIVLLSQLFLHKNLKICQQPTRAQVVFHVENNKGIYEKITKELDKYKISLFQFKWERKSKNLLQLRCQVVIPAELSKEEIVQIFTNIAEMETFEIL